MNAAQARQLTCTVCCKGKVRRCHSLSFRRANVSDTCTGKVTTNHFVPVLWPQPHLGGACLLNAVAAASTFRSSIQGNQEMLKLQSFLMSDEKARASAQPLQAEMSCIYAVTHETSPPPPHAGSHLQTWSHARPGRPTEHTRQRVQRSHVCSACTGSVVTPAYTTSTQTAA